MTLFMDVHNRVEGATAEAVAGAHQKDLDIQDRYGVKYLKYWLDEATCKIFCLAEAPDRDSAVRVHREAHGLLAADGRVPLGFRMQERIPMLRHLAARIFGLGVWPVRLSPAPARRPAELSPLPAQM